MKDGLTLGSEDQVTKGFSEIYVVAEETYHYLTGRMYKKE